MRIYIGVTLSECVCTMAGFGAYPLEADSASGGGPKKEYLSLLGYVTLLTLLYYYIQ